MFFAFPLGLSYALINAPAQTVLHERAPAEMRGRIFTTQVVSANFFSLLPLLLIGAITDLLGISLVLMLVALGVSVAGVLNVRVARRSGQVEASNASAPTISAQPHDQVVPPVDIDTKESAKLE
jgi:hypothetical protein